jgi:hypothetical protein
MAIMTDWNRVSCVAATLLACLSLAVWTGTGDAAVPDRAVVIPYEDAKFTPIDPSQRRRCLTHANHCCGRLRSELARGI